MRAASTSTSTSTTRPCASPRASLCSGDGRACASRSLEMTRRVARRNGELTITCQVIPRPRCNSDHVAAEGSSAAQCGAMMRRRPRPCRALMKSECLTTAAAERTKPRAGPRGFGRSATEHRTRKLDADLAWTDRGDPSKFRKICDKKMNREKGTEVTLAGPTRPRPANDSPFQRPLAVVAENGALLYFCGSARRFRALYPAIPRTYVC